MRTTPVTTHCRSTALIAALESLRRNGWWDAYRRAADPEALAAVEAATAGEWLSFDVAVAHYRACETLGMSPQAQADMGGSVFHRIQGSVFGTVVKALGHSGGISPLTVIPRFNDMSARSFRGGGCQLVRVGPKDVRVDMVGCPAADIPYFRGSYRGFLRAGTLLLAKQAMVLEVPTGRAKGCVSYRVSWV